MKNQKPRVHFTNNYLLDPTNPVSVILIGAGGTGSQVLTALAKINHALIALGHAGLQVTVFDNDIVTTANQGRQLFADAEVGLHKAVALVNRCNRFFGTDWKAVADQFSNETVATDSGFPANITLSCVDTVKARFEIASILTGWTKTTNHRRDKPLYWMDFGNGQHSGQLLLATLGKHEQPKSRKFIPVASLPMVTEEYKTELLAVDENETPSCSLAEALLKQDLFINPPLANFGGSLLWQMFREGMIKYKGCFLNLKDLRTQPIII